MNNASTDTKFKHRNEIFSTAGQETLHFSIVDGNVTNTFFRCGPVAAHLLLTSGFEPRILIAFPAGNSGVGLWFTTSDERTTFGEPKIMRAVTRPDAAGRPLYGIETEIELMTGGLTVRQAVLSSTRVLREYQFDARLPNGVTNNVNITTKLAEWSRDRLDGAPGYLLSVEVVDGDMYTSSSGETVFSSKSGNPLKIKVTALSGETPLTPLSTDSILRDPQVGDLRTRQSLMFLSYQEKLLAGSWRFNTYFGRDTLMSVRLLMPALTSAAIEAALGSVLSRLSPQGSVAHEEDIGECALLQNIAHRRTTGAAPIFDYKMVDDDFMLAPVIATYLLDDPQGQLRAEDFLELTSADGVNYGELLIHNFRKVLTKSMPFAQQRSVANLIYLKSGEVVGDWRDSHDGLGGGAVSYSVNVVLVPAALRAIAALSSSKLFAPYLRKDDNLSVASTIAAAWEDHARTYFKVSVDANTARRNIKNYASEMGIDSTTPCNSVPTEGLQFDAIALDQTGAPIPVMHTDLGFALLFQNPSNEVLEKEVATIMRPFPAGLLTGAGVVVANAAQAENPLRSLFGPDCYHGAVIWSWQQAMLAAGLARQLKRTDISESVRSILTDAQSSLWEVILSTRAMGNSELWSWSYLDGLYSMRPFGPQCATADESNAAQLWSTVYLAVKPSVDK